MISVSGQEGLGRRCTPPPLPVVGVSVWGCFIGSFVVWRVFLVRFGVGLLLFSY
jgi:hypothetical protein